MSTEPSRESKEPTRSAGGTGPAHRPRRAVPGGAVGKARSGVRGTANRLGRVASSTTAAGRSAAGGLTTTAATAADTAKGVTTTTAGTTKGALATTTGATRGALTATAGMAKGAVTTVTGTVVKPLLTGAAFALVVRKVMLFIRFLRQLALQLLEALRQLALRLREAADRYRGGAQDEAIEGEEAGGSPDERSEAAPARRPEGSRPVRPRPDAARPEPPAPAERRHAPAARRPERLGGRAPGAGGPH